MYLGCTFNTNLPSPLPNSPKGLCTGQHTRANAGGEGLHSASANSPPGFSEQGTRPPQPLQRPDRGHPVRHGGKRHSEGHRALTRLPLPRDGSAGPGSPPASRSNGHPRPLPGTPRSQEPRQAQLQRGHHAPSLGSGGYLRQASSHGALPLRRHKPAAQGRARERGACVPVRSRHRARRGSLPRRTPQPRHGPARPRHLTVVLVEAGIEQPVAVRVGREQVHGSCPFSSARRSLNHGDPHPAASAPPREPARAEPSRGGQAGGRFRPCQAAPPSAEATHPAERRAPSNRAARGTPLRPARQWRREREEGPRRRRGCTAGLEEELSEVGGSRRKTSVLRGVLRRAQEPRAALRGGGGWDCSLPARCR